MSPKTALRIEFFSVLVLCILFGAWLILSFQQWMNGNLTALWIAGTLFFAGAVAFDTYKIFRNAWPASSESAENKLPEGSVQAGPFLGELSP
jgi:hypothetical protein